MITCLLLHYFGYRLNYFDANGVISTHWIKFYQVNLIQTHPHCPNDFFIINRGLIWPTWLLNSFVCFSYCLNYFDTNGSISTNWIEFDQMSTIQTRSYCSNEVFVINRGLIRPNFNYLLILHVFRYRLNYFDANSFIFNPLDCKWSNERDTNSFPMFKWSFWHQ